MLKVANMSDEKAIGWRSLNFDFNVDDDEDDEDFEESENDVFADDEDDDGDFNPVNLKLPKVLITPMGPFKLDDSLNPFRHFEFWMGHCNFNLSPKVVSILEKTPGVEILKVLTRYTFVVGIGNMFDFHDVRENIEKQLLSPKKISSSIDNIEYKNILLDRYDRLSKNKYWAILILPDGKIDEITSEIVDDEFMQMLNLYKESRDNCNAVIYVSDSELLNGKAAS